MRQFGWSSLGAAVVAALSAGPARAQVELLDDGPSHVDFGAGVFNLGRGHGDPTAAMGRLEFRLGEKLMRIGPMAGIMANTRGGVYAYGGLYADIAIDRWVLTPTAAVGGYSRGSRKISAVVSSSGRVPNWPIASTATSGSASASPISPMSASTTAIPARTS